jgi:N-acetylglutamate synthase-like GNAT family acetyltransferase
MQLSLALTNEERLLPGVKSLLNATLAETPLAPPDAAALADLAHAAVENAVRTAYPIGETGEVELTLHEDHDQLEIRIRDDGLPQNVHALQRGLHHAGAPAFLHGADAAHAADDMHWLALGAKGKALQLVKHLPAPHIAGEDAPQRSGAPTTHEVPLAPPQQYAIRRLRPEDAVQVSQLMYRTYGSTYFNESVYYPRRITSQNHRQTLLSIVAAGEDGRIVGHCALERRPDSPVAELGQAAVDPAHRGRGLLDQMKDAAQAEAAALGLVGWFADAVTVHQFTQQSNAHHGGRVCGVDLAVSPQSESFRNIADAQPQRVSCIVYFHWIDEPQPRTAFVPPRHQEMAAAIYENLACPVEFGKAAAPTADHSELSVTFSRRAALATIRAGQIGKDTARVICRAGREIIERSRAEVVVVELPLADPAVANVCEELEKEGYAFAGLGPHFEATSDVLKLTYLVRPLARAPIKTYEPFADQLVNYALMEQARVRANQ